MEKLILHIEYLLRRHDCVVVPGLGAFLIVRHNACRDADTEAWMPMTEEVRFNGSIRHDDAMLASSYVRRDNLDYAQAKEQIHQSVRNLQQAMEENGEMTIGNIGTLISSGETISFQPAYKPEMMARRMGFLPVDDRKDRQQLNDKNPAIATRLRDFDTDRNYYIAINKRLARYAVAVALLVIMAISILLPVNKDFKEDQASIFPVQAITSALIGQNESEQAGDKVETTNTRTPELNAETEPDEWQLIVGTFTTEAEARRFIEINGNRGYNLTILPSQRLHRVSALGAEKKEQLLSILNSAEFQSIYGEAWIYHHSKK